MAGLLYARNGAINEMARSMKWLGSAAPGAAGRLAFEQPVFLDPVTVGLEQHLGAAMVADLLRRPLDHAVTFARLGEQHLPGAGDLEALLGARFGLEFGHLALLFRNGAATRARS